MEELSASLEAACVNLSADSAASTSSGCSSSASGGVRRSWDVPGESLSATVSVYATSCRALHGCATRLTLLHKTQAPKVGGGGGGGDGSSGAGGAPGNLAGKEAVLSICKEIKDVVNHLSAAVLAARHAGAMECLAALLTSNARRVLRVMLDLVRSVVERNLAKWNMLTGAVWEACEAAASAPCNNREAARRQVMQWSLTVKDTIDEFSEEVNSWQQGCGDRDGTRGGSLGPGGDYDQEDETYSGEELRAVNALVLVLKACRGAFRLNIDLMGSLSTKGKEDEDPESIADAMCSWGQGALDRLQRLHDSTQDIGMQLYPPLSKVQLEEVLGQCESAFKGLHYWMSSEILVRGLKNPEKDEMFEKFQSRWEEAVGQCQALLD